MLAWDKMWALKWSNCLQTQAEAWFDRLLTSYASIIPLMLLFFKEKKEMKAKDKIKFKIKDLFNFVLSFLFSKK